MQTLLQNPFFSNQSPKKKHFALSAERYTDKKFHDLEVSFWWNFMKIHRDIEEIHTDLVVCELCKHDVGNFLHEEMYVRRTITVIENKEDLSNLRDSLFYYITGRLSKEYAKQMDSGSEDSD